MIKRILGAIFTVWAALIFLLTMLIFFIPLWATGLIREEPRRTKVFLDVIRVWMKVYFILIFLRLTVKGREKFKPGQNYIVVCNHNSNMDVPLSSPQIPGANRTIAKAELKNIPVFGTIYKRGSVLVDRKSDTSRKESYNEMKKVLELGMHMCIYPEGTRNRTNQPLKSFQDGAFRLAVATGKPLMPTVIFNTGKVLPHDKSFYFWPHPVEMHFLDPIEVREGDTPEMLKEKVFRIMWDYYAANR